MPERHESVTADGWDDLGCSDSRGKLLTSLGIYDISACDVFDEGLDLLYTPGMVYHRHSSMPAWKYACLVILAIILVRFLSYNVQALWHPAEAQQKEQVPAIVCCLLTLAIVLTDRDDLLVTSADQVFLWSTVAYIAVYLVMHIARIVGDEQNRKKTGGWDQDEQDRIRSGGQELEPQAKLPVYNVLVASLQLIATRFYSAAETPYNLVLITILACRGWYVFWWGELSSQLEGASFKIVLN
jgi:hypothetical protein